MPDRLRTRAFVALALLAAAQLFHLLDVLRDADDAEFPDVLVDPLAVTGIGAAVVALAAIVLRRSAGPQIAIAAGGAVAIGFMLYHGIPVDLGVNNPYWGPASDGADAIQWISVLVAIATGAVGGVARLAATGAEACRHQRMTHGLSGPRLEEPRAG